MMTFKNKVNDIAQIKDFYTFAEALEEYAIDGKTEGTSAHRIRAACL